MASTVPPIVSAAEASGLMDDASVVWIDARGGAAGMAGYEQEHIRGARHMDLETELSGDTSRPDQGGRHPLPNLVSFAGLLARNGLSRDKRVIVYDDKGGANAAARLWWMLTAVGYERVQVLDGGLQAALRLGLPTESGRPAPISEAPVEQLRAWARPAVSMSEIQDHIRDGWLLIDVRENDRYRGEREPIDPVAGHIPGAENLFCGHNVDEHGNFLPAHKLKQQYTALLEGRSPEKVIVSCGSGVTACHTLLALEHAGLKGASLYVGSWSEWCRNHGTESDPT